ncbi:amidohydrolase family protein [Sphingomonas sp. 4RDLI-65]|uniref:amidohydrolase family protein n=1 Tax=Sphingomonas sp. 4RDLI-65 TaxID=3111641 RepID=UPI003C27F2A1
MTRIDAHQHFWCYSTAEYGWIDADGVLARDYGPADLMPLLDSARVDGCIAVQALQTETETDRLLDLAAANPRIVGVVGWVDLCADDLEARLDRWQAPALVGFRHLVQGEPADDFLLTPSFVRGVRTVLARGFSYDILVTPRQAGHVRRFVDSVADAAVDGRRLILDHGAKPDIAGGGWQPWADAIADMAQAPSFSCKISGLVTEADHAHWTADQIARYLDHLLACFGPDRLIFGSDWPVCLLAADYARVHDLIDAFVTRSCPEARSQIFGGTAAIAYGL